MYSTLGFSHSSLYHLMHRGVYKQTCWRSEKTCNITSWWKSTIVFHISTRAQDMSMSQFQVSMSAFPAGSATLPISHSLNVLPTRSVAVSIMQLTYGCCTWSRADHLGNPLALLQESSQMSQLWERTLSEVFAILVHCSSASRCCPRWYVQYIDFHYFWTNSSSRTVPCAHGHLWKRTCVFLSIGWAVICRVKTHLTPAYE